MKRTWILILAMMLALCMLPACTSGGDSGEASDDVAVENLEDEDTALDEKVAGQFEDEDETMELKVQKVEDSFFYGTWEAESDRASYMYGNVTITINEDGTWDGNITDEDVHGTWKHSGDGIALTSDIIPFNMVYSDNNNVVLQEEDDAVRVVLTRQ